MSFISNAVNIRNWPVLDERHDSVFAGYCLDDIPRACVLPQALAVIVHSKLESLKAAIPWRANEINTLAFTYWAWNFGRHCRLKDAPKITRSDDVNYDILRLRGSYSLNQKFPRPRTTNSVFIPETAQVSRKRDYYEAFFEGNPDDSSNPLMQRNLTQLHRLVEKSKVQKAEQERKKDEERKERAKLEATIKELRAEIEELKEDHESVLEDYSKDVQRTVDLAVAYGLHALVKHDAEQGEVEEWLKGFPEFPTPPMLEEV